MTFSHDLILSGVDQLDFFDDIAALRKQVWPDFIRVPSEKIRALYERFPDYQFSLFNHETNKLAAIFNTVPLVWKNNVTQLPDEGVSWAIATSLNADDDMRAANTLCAVSMTVAPEHQQAGISKTFLNYVIKLAKRQKFTSLIAPVRPNLKCKYPLIPIENYVEWRRADGSRFDPWLRVHEMLGAEILHVCQHSAMVTASIEDWKKWTGRDYPGDGAYIINDALMPVEIDCANQIGKYVEPNVWVCYRL